MKELGSRINTTVFSGGIICLLLFFTICILSSAMAIRNSMNHVLETCTPVDVQVSKLYSYDAAEDYDITGHNVEENLKACDIDTSKLTDVTEMILYAPEEIRVGDFFGKAFAESGSEDYFKEASMETMHIGDYNAFVSSFGGTTIDLAEDEYVILCNYGEMEPRYNEGLAEGQTVTIKGKTYHPKYSTCVDGIVHISNSESNAGVLLPLAKRELVTFCFLFSQGGCDMQVVAHAKGNMKIGNDKELLMRVISQSLPYIGYPRCLNAVNCVNEAERQMKQE